MFRTSGSSLIRMLGAVKPGGFGGIQRNHSPRVDNVMGNRGTAASLNTRPSWLTPDNVVLSPTPDVELKMESYRDYLFPLMLKHGNNTACVDGISGRKISFSELVDLSVKCGSGLIRMGLTREDMLVISGPSQIDYVILVLAAGACGIPIAALNPLSPAPELARLLAHVKATAVATTPELSPVVNEAIGLRERSENKIKAKIAFGNCEGYKSFSEIVSDDGTLFPDNLDIDVMRDVLSIYFSSGTTGPPKATVGTHFSLVSNTKILGRVLNNTCITDGGSALNMMPFFHIYGQLVMIAIFLAFGQKSVIIPRFDPKVFVNAIQDHKFNFLPIVPPLAVFMAKSPLMANKDLHFVKSIICGAAPLSAEITDVLKNAMPDVNIIQGYGMTECGVCTADEHIPARAGTAGQMLSNCKSKVIEIGGDRTLGQGQVGEIYLKSPFTMREYLNNPVATKEVILEDGWVRTGDVGKYDEDGYITITDRIKDVIIYKGHNISPTEIEVILLEHPEIVDAAVIGVPDEHAGETPKAFIVKAPDSPLTPDDVHVHVKKQLSPLQYLRGGVQFVQEIPKTGSGKILRRILRDPS